MMMLLYICKKLKPKTMKKQLLFILCVLLYSLSISAQTTIRLRPDAATGKDAMLHGLESNRNNNYGSVQDLIMSAWTYATIPGFTRSIIEFDLSSIPSNSYIINAALSLYYNYSSGNPGHTDRYGSNDWLIQRVTSSWNENTVTYNTHPAYTLQNQILMPGCIGCWPIENTDDYPDIDVTALVQNMVDDPANSFGFLLRLQTEVYYRSMLFATSDHADTSIHPKLVITYGPATSIKENEFEQKMHDVYPNPMITSSTLFLGNLYQEISFTLYNILSEQVRHMEGITDDHITIHRGNLPNGLYFYSLRNSEGVIKTGKLVVQ